MKHAVIEDLNVNVLEFFAKVSTAAKNEKQATIDLTQMMYWWTKKPVVVGRAAILSTLFEKISDVEMFMGLDSTRPWAYDEIKPDDFTKKLGSDPKNIKVLDPFGGSGNLAFAAAHLGLDVTVSDYNPVAWLIERAVLEYPVSYRGNLREDFSKYANKVIDATKRDVGKYFPKSHLTYLWCWCIRCPHCSQRFPLLNHMYVAKTSKKRIGIKLIIKKKDFSVELVQDVSDTEGKKYTQKGGNAVCISCQTTLKRNILEDYITKYKDREIIAVQYQEKKGRKYIKVTKEVKDVYLNAVKDFERKRKKFEEESLIPNEDILASFGKKNTLWNYGIRTWDQYFDPRQMLILCTFMENIIKTCDQITDKPRQKIIATYLAFILAKRINNAGFGVIWDAGSTKPVHALTMRRPNISYNFAESNPFEKINGSIINITESITRAIKFTERLTKQSRCENLSVTSESDLKYDVIITDPPYGDDVQYGELSEFFYVWMYRILKKYYDLPARIRLDEDYCESQGRFEDKKKAQEFFGAGLKKSFVAIQQKLKDDGLLVVLFAHSNPKTWAQLISAVQNAKLRIVSSYPVHTEMQTNPMARNKMSFMSSIMVTCRKITEESTRYYEDIILETDKQVESALEQIDVKKLLAIPITDLLIMITGKVLESSTQHTVLKSYEKNVEPKFDELIEKAHNSILKRIVFKLLKKQPASIGPYMSFYLLAKIFIGNQLSRDAILKLGLAYNVSTDSLKKHNMIMQNGDLHLTSLKRDVDYDPEEIDHNNLYEQLCYLVSSNPSNHKKLLLHNNVRKDDLMPIVSILIKNHMRQPSLDKINSEELHLLKTLADHMGITVEQEVSSVEGSTMKDKRTRKSMGDERQTHL